MTEQTVKQTYWQRTKNALKKLRQEGPKVLFEVFSFSLLFMLGLVTLGMSLLAGIAAILIAKWHQRKMQNDVANPDYNPKEENNQPITAV